MKTGPRIIPNLRWWIGGLLFASTVILIVTASAASREFRWKEALASGVLFALLAIAVFVFGLKIQLPVWPPFLAGYH